jgi:hypothetical protein
LFRPFAGLRAPSGPRLRAGNSSLPPGVSIRKGLGGRVCGTSRPSLVLVALVPRLRRRLRPRPPAFRPPPWAVARALTPVREALRLQPRQGRLDLLGLDLMPGYLPKPRPANAMAGGDGVEQAHGQRLRRGHSQAPAEDQPGRHPGITPYGQRRFQMLRADRRCHPALASSWPSDTPWKRCDHPAVIVAARRATGSGRCHRATHPRRLVPGSRDAAGGRAAFA